MFATGETSSGRVFAAIIVATGKTSSVVRPFRVRVGFFLLVGTVRHHVTIVINWLDVCFPMVTISFLVNRGSEYHRQGFGRLRTSS